MIMTRAQYMDAISGDEVSDTALHRKYYAQFVTAAIRNHVLRTLGAKAIADSKDEWLNDIPLHRWDQLQPAIIRLADKVAWLDAHGHGGFSLSDIVCIAKEAAKQIKEGNHDH